MNEKGSKLFSVDASCEKPCCAMTKDTRENRPTEITLDGNMYSLGD